MGILRIDKQQLPLDTVLAMPVLTLISGTSTKIFLRYYKAAIMDSGHFGGIFEIILRFPQHPIVC